MLISEIFGYGVDNQSNEAWATRTAKRCPFRDSPCTKSSKSDPIGVCSLSDGSEAASLCPTRFVEGDLIFKDAARLAFGEGTQFGIFPEVRILKIASEIDGERERKIGKVDYLLGRINSNQVTDFAAVEVQAAYFSGEEIRTPLEYYLSNRRLKSGVSDRRPDFRSSAQKRLMPQLQLKVPVFRRWGKKFFVVVDSQFFKSLPAFRPTSRANSEITWLNYTLRKEEDDYRLGELRIVFSEWDEVRNALREGSPPEPEEVIRELQTKLNRTRSPARILSV